MSEGRGPIEPVMGSAFSDAGRELISVGGFLFRSEVGYNLNYDGWGFIDPEKTEIFFRTRLGHTTRLAGFKLVEPKTPIAGPRVYRLRKPPTVWAEYITLIVKAGAWRTGFTMVMHSHPGNSTTLRWSWHDKPMWPGVLGGGLLALGLGTGLYMLRGR